jgi:hypothetical protein
MKWFSLVSFVLYTESSFEMTSANICYLFCLQAYERQLNNILFIDLLKTKINLGYT